MNKTFYEMQASRIEATLAARNIAARVWDATVTPRYVRYTLTHAIGVDVSRIERLQNDIAYNLNARAVRVYREGGQVCVEVPRDDASRFVEYKELRRRVPRWPKYTALLGVDDADNPLMLRLDSPTVSHVLVAGATGSGKSALLATLVASLLEHNHAGLLQVVALDQKGFKAEWMRGLLAVPTLVSEDEETLDALDDLVALMLRRRPGHTAPRIVVLIDELGELCYRVPAAVQRIVRLTAGGREVGIHVIAGIQRPAARLIGNMAKANFPCRIVGSVTSADDAKCALGVGGSGAEKLLGKGDMILYNHGEMVRFQAAYTSPADLQAIGDALGRISRPVVRVKTPEPLEPPEPPIPRELPQVLTPDVVEELRRRYRQLGTLNRVLYSAGWKKGPKTLSLLKEALGGNQDAADAK